MTKIDRRTQLRAMDMMDEWVAQERKRDEIIVFATEAGLSARLVARQMGISVPTVVRARRKAREAGEIPCPGSS